jgi:hypothetical protein
MRPDVALYKDCALEGIETRGNIHGRHLTGKATQCLRVLNFVDGVHIGDAEVVFLELLPRGPRSKGAKVVAQMQGPGGLNA